MKTYTDFVTEDRNWRIEECKSISHSIYRLLQRLSYLYKKDKNNRVVKDCLKETTNLAELLEFYWDKQGILKSVSNKKEVKV